MSKQKKGYDIANFGHVTPAIIGTVEQVISDKARGRYSVSAIYKAHNFVFKLAEPMQTCDSCLVTRASALANWYDWYKAQSTKGGVQVPEQVPTAPVATDRTQGDVIVDENGKSKVIPVGAVDGAQGLVNIPAPGEATGTTDGADVGGADHHEGDGVGTPAANEGAQGTETNGAATNALQAPIVPPAATGAAVEVLLQQVEKDDYSKTKGDPLYAIYTPSADDVNVGTATNKETGKGLAPGTYATEDTTKVLVVGFGKATYKPVA